MGGKFDHCECGHRRVARSSLSYYLPGTWSEKNDVPSSSEGAGCINDPECASVQFHLQAATIPYISLTDLSLRSLNVHRNAAAVVLLYGLSYLTFVLPSAMYAVEFTL